MLENLCMKKMFVNVPARVQDSDGHQRQGASKEEDGADHCCQVSPVLVSVHFFNKKENGGGCYFFLRLLNLWSPFLFKIVSWRS